MEKEFSKLERNILKAKGLTEEQIASLIEMEVASLDDLRTVGDAATLAELIPQLDPAVAEKVMEWATGRAQPKASAAAAVSSSSTMGGKIVIDTADMVYCIHCSAKQPKDYKSGDLCVACGKQAEPILSCFWCSASGPGKFCRSCGAAFVPTAELDLAVLLRHEGLPKDEIPRKLDGMSAEDKDVLWGRVRKFRR